MLKLFRKKNVTKMILWGILILILPAFVLWGTGNVGRGGKRGPSYAGEIDGKRISFDQFGRALTGARCQMMLSFFSQPKILDEFLGNKELVGKMAWDRLIMEREAKKAGMKAGNPEVVAFIKSRPIFLRNGQFDSRVYDYVLQRVPIDPRSFEEIVRDNIIIQKLNDSIAKDITVTDEEIRDLFKRENEKFKISYVAFPSESFIEKARAGDDKIKGYYESHAKEFVVPEKVLDDGTVIGGEVAKLEDVKGAIGDFLTAVEARKLALKSAGEEHRKIKGLMEKDGLSFETAADALKLKRLETDYFARGEHLEDLGEAGPITDAAVKLKAGGISEPVEIRNGAVIFKLAEVRNPDEEKLEKEKSDYSAKARATKKLTRLEKWLKEMEAKNRALIDFRDYEKYYR